MTNSTTDVSGNTTMAPFTEECRMFTIMVDGVLLGGLVLLSVIGNTVSLLTWHSVSKLRGLSSTVIMLQCLAVSDTILVIPLLFVTVIPLNLHLVHPENAYDRTVYPYMMKYVWPFSSIANFITVWITTLITIHRFHVVCYPFSLRRARLTSVRSTSFQVIAITFFAVLYNIPRFLEFDLTLQQNASVNIELTLSDMLRDSQYQIWYRNVSYIILMSVLPLLVTSLLTMKILRTVTKASDEREWMTGSQRISANGRCSTPSSSSTSSFSSSSSISVLLISLILMFLICQTPTAIVRILLAVEPRLVVCGSLMFYFQEIGLLMVAVNSSTNIIIYAACSADFRGTARAIVTCQARPVYRTVTGQLSGRTTSLSVMYNDSFSRRSLTPSPRLKNSLRPDMIPNRYSVRSSRLATSKC